MTYFKIDFGDIHISQIQQQQQQQAESEWNWNGRLLGHLPVPGSECDAARDDSFGL